MISYPVMPQPGRPALVLALCLLLARPSFLLGQSCHSPRTALVLSGGGAKGLAHVGVLRVLDSLGIRPDLDRGYQYGRRCGRALRQRVLGARAGFPGSGGTPRAAVSPVPAPCPPQPRRAAAPGVVGAGGAPLQSAERRDRRVRGQRAGERRPAPR